MTPDGRFPTVESPNPEYKKSFQMAIKLAEATQAFFGRVPFSFLAVIRYSRSIAPDWFPVRGINSPFSFLTQTPKEIRTR